MRAEQSVEQLVYLAARLHCDHATPKLIQGDGVKGSESYLTVSTSAQLPVRLSAFERRALRALKHHRDNFDDTLSRHTYYGYGIYRTYGIYRI